MKDRIVCIWGIALLIGVFFSSPSLIAANTIINFTGKIKKGQDISSIVKEAIEKAPKTDLELIFPKGVYHFSAKDAFKKTYSITNHENGEKSIAFLFDGFSNVKIKGNGSEFLFTGAMLPFLFINSQGVELSGCSIDWTVPFYLQGEVTRVDKKSGSYDIRLESDGYNYKVEGNRLVFPDQDGFSYSGAGESLVFDKASKSPVYNANLLDMHRKQNPDVILLPNGDIRMTEKIKTYPPIGSVITFKGPAGENRYAPAIHALRSKDITIKEVNVYHALGMGFLGEVSENILLKGFNVKLRQGSSRILSATADATHFCNCKGNVMVDGCLFENMLDDGTNVHGTFVKIEEVLSNHKLRASLVHFQQAGFEFARSGDKSWFLISPLPQRTAENTITECRMLDDFQMEITFAGSLPDGLKKGDLVENKTWNTDSFTMRNCTIRNHRARNIVLKTPGKTLIENNFLHSMMASILMRPEAHLWYESGANENTVIRNNIFQNCTFGGGDQALLFISPRFGKSFDQTNLIDKNILFENNTIHTFDNKIIHATSVDGLTVRNNKITRTLDFKPFNPGNPLIDLYYCKDVTIEGNQTTFGTAPLLRMDKQTESSAKVKL